MELSAALAQVLDVSVGAAAKPHPFKRPDGVANTRRDYGPGDEVHGFFFPPPQIHWIRRRKGERQRYGLE